MVPCPRGPWGDRRPVSRSLWALYASLDLFWWVLPKASLPFGSNPRVGEVSELRFQNGESVIRARKKKGPSVVAQEIGYGAQCGSFRRVPRKIGSSSADFTGAPRPDLEINPRTRDGSWVHP